MCRRTFAKNAWAWFQWSSPLLMIYRWSNDLVLAVKNRSWFPLLNMTFLKWIPSLQYSWIRTNAFTPSASSWHTEIPCSSVDTPKHFISKQQQGKTKVQGYFLSKLTALYSTRCWLTMVSNQAPAQPLTHWPHGM